MKLKIILKIRQVGNSYGILLPKSSIKALGLTEKDIKENKAYLVGFLEGRKL
ncbi:MAG: hypothetical protein QW051_04860 [Candidatus Aenigmatarchaeota archaeon]